MAEISESVKMSASVIVFFPLQEGGLKGNCVIIKSLLTGKIMSDFDLL